MRLLNRLLAALLSLALIVGGVLLIIEVIADRTTHRYVVVNWAGAYHWAERTIWQAGSIRVACIVLLAVGLLLLLAELKRPRVTRLPIATSGDNADYAIDVAYTRRGVAAALRSSVTQVDGIGAAQVKVKHRSVRIRADAAAHDEAAAQRLQDPATAAAAARLAALRLTSTPSLSVHVNPRSR